MNNTKELLESIGAIGTITDVDQFLKGVADFAQQHQLVIQVFDAEAIYGKFHLISAVNHAQRAMERKTNTTNTLAMEILLYASGERQLKLAIPKVGVKKGKGAILLVVVDKKKRSAETLHKQIDDLLQQYSLKRNDGVLKGTRQTLRVFGIGEKELQTVTKAKYGDLILEKVAMVDIIK